MEKNDFKEILRSKREELGESQGALGEAVGCSLKTVSRWEFGERFPDGIMLSRLASHFGCTTDELLGRDSFRDISSTGRNVGENLRRIREARNLRVRDIAEALGVAEATYYRWESGDRELSAGGIVRLTRILGCSPNDILLGEEVFPQGKTVGNDEERPLFGLDCLKKELETYFLRALHCSNQIEYSIFPACVELYKQL